MKSETIARIAIWMAQHFPRWLFIIAAFFRSMYKNILMSEQCKSFGTLNPDKTFYVIRLCPPGSGFLANYVFVLGYMKYAFDKGWIPVVDMENYTTYYQETIPVEIEEEVYTRNVWEYYFLQPLDQNTNKRYSLKEVYQSKNVILAKVDDPQMYTTYTNPRDVTSIDKNTLKWQKEMSLLVPFREEIQKKIDFIYSTVLPRNGQIIGVPTRGSDLSKRVIGHPISIKVEDIVPLIITKSTEWNISNIFITGEEEETIEYIKTNVPNVYSTNAHRIRKYNIKKSEAAPVANKGTTKYQALLEYLMDISILSRCTSILGTMNNGLYTALIWNNFNYTHCEIINNGVWK